MYQNPTKSARKPILLAQSTKVHATKINQTESSPNDEIRPNVKSKQRQKEIMTIIHCSQGIESPRLARTSSNSYQNSSENSNSQKPPKDSPDSLRRKIRDQSKYTFQQSQLIKKLHNNLVRAELVTGNSCPNLDEESSNQFANLSKRLDYLVDTYINQNDILKRNESRALEQSKSQLNELNLQISQLKAQIEDQKNQIDQLSNKLHEQSDENSLLKSYLFTLKEKTPTSITFYELDDYTFDSVIGSGSTSNVNAVYKKEKYAQKELKDFTFDKFKGFLSECEILFKLHHPCIIRVHGFNTGDETHPPSMILSLENISLENAILEKLLDNHQKNRIIVEIVLGMRYIHKLNIMHRDLKPLNILLSKNMHVKISDFGLAKEEDIEISQSKGIGTVRFMAPELFVNEDDEDDDENKNKTRYTNKVDVYSFGITLIYIVTEKYPPFKMKEVVNGKIPKIKGPIVDWVSELIVRCLSISPDDRPSFSEIFEIIKSHDYNLFNIEQKANHEIAKKEIEKRIQKIEAFEYQHQNE